LETYWYNKIDNPKFEGPKKLQSYFVLVSYDEKSLLKDFNEVSFPFAPPVEQPYFRVLLADDGLGSILPCVHI
jgi:hypothetical protein